jgi:Glucokinase
MRAGHAAPEWLRARLQREDPGAVVGEVGLAGRDPVCVDALDLFITIYGAQAGNLALEGLALGGSSWAAASLRRSRPSSAMADS